MTPKAAATLALLHERAGEVVSKEEILERVWSGSFVTDDALWHSIAELRRIFDDDPRNPKVIETLPRRGYRLVAASPVPAHRPADDSPCGASVPPSVGGSSSGARTLPVPFPPAAEPREPAPAGAPAGREVRVVAAVLVLGFCVAAGWMLSDFVQAPRPGVGEIAKAAAIADPLDRGLEDYVKYTGPHNERAIAWLEAAVDREPDNARARAALADAYAQKVFHSAEPWWRRRALEEARRAVELAPELAEGHKALGLAETVARNPHAALAAYRRALELKPNYPEALNNLGALEFDRGGISVAVGRFRKALQGQPRDALYLTNLGTCLRILGLEPEAQEVLRAGAVPASASFPENRWQRALIDLHEGAHEAARLRLEAALKGAPRDRELLWRATEVELIRGRPAEALAFARRALAERGGAEGLSEIRPALLWARLEGGAEARTRAIARADLRWEKQARSSGSAEWALMLAADHLALSDPAQAMGWLVRAVEWGFRDRVRLSVDPVFEALRGEARFRALLDEMEELVARERARLQAQT